MKLPVAILGAALVSLSTASAWKWAEEPQPLLRYEAQSRDSISDDTPALRNRAVVEAEAGAPLAWDHSARVLWYISGPELVAQLWTGHTFIERTAEAIVADPAGGLLVDSGWHFVYYLAPDGTPHCARRGGRLVVARKMGDEPLSRLLAVDPRSHAVFGYDDAARGIRRYSYLVQTRSWTSRIVATGLGPAGDAAVMDPLRAVLYSSHETADDSVPRHPEAGTVSDPTGIGAWKPWPLVATRWDGSAWISQVLDETGVPQMPAVRITDHSVFYARRDEPEQTYFYKPRSAGAPEAFGNIAGWSGADTYVDDRRYTIRAPRYPPSWSYGSSFSFNWSVSSNDPISWLSGTVNLRGPITIVPCYAPVWTDVALPRRLTAFRAVVNPRKNQLVQHREVCSGEIVRTQTGKTLVRYLYRDADGVLARQFRIVRPSPTSTWGYEWTWYPQLSGDFDPANPPANFADLADAMLNFQTDKLYSTTSGSTIPAIDPSHSINPDAPFVGPHVRLPTAVKLRTFGHDYRRRTGNQTGSRYQDYRDVGTTWSVASQLAVDLPTGVTFYTQAPAPPAQSQSYVPVSYGATPLARFSDPEWKLTRPTQSGWVVMVY